MWDLLIMGHIVSVMGLQSNAQKKFLAAVKFGNRSIATSAGRQSLNSANASIHVVSTNLSGYSTRYVTFASCPKLWQSGSSCYGGPAARNKTGGIRILNSQAGTAQVEHKSPVSPVYGQLHEEASLEH